MFTQGFGEVLTDILTINPELSGIPSASSILDTSNYTFQAVTFGKDADGFNHHAHTIINSKIDTNSVSGKKNLVIFAGQSNMNGYAESSQDPIKGVKYWNVATSSFVDTIRPGTNTFINNSFNHFTYNANGQWGPEVSFAQNLVANNIADTYILKVAQDNSTVADARKLPTSALGAFAEDNRSSWSPSATATELAGSFNGRDTTLWQRFVITCNDVIDELGGISQIGNVTLLWSQGESESYFGQDNDELALQHSELTKYFLDETKDLFDGCDSFNIIRVKVNSKFGEGGEPSYRYYPSGMFEFLGNDPTNITPTDLNNYLIYRLGYAGNNPALLGLDLGGSVGLLYPELTSCSAPGFYGNYSYSSTPTVRAQQESLDESVYGPLISLDDLKFVDSLTGTVAGLLEPTEPSVQIEIPPTNILTTVSAFHATGTSYTSTNIHYNAASLLVKGKRLYDKWVELTNPKVASVSSFNDGLIVARNYSGSDVPFASSYNMSATYDELSSTYNSVALYPAINHRRLEIASTKTVNAESYSGSLPDTGHYVNVALSSSPLSGMWNVIGSFPPSGYADWDYFILSADVDTGVYLNKVDNLQDHLSDSLATSGQLSGSFNASGVMDLSGFLTFNPLSGIGPALSALGTEVSGSAFSGGALVFSSVDNNVSAGIANVAVRLQEGDAAAIALFGGLNHLGVWCLDVKDLVSSGITPPFAWDHLDNIRRYKLVSKVSFWDNLLSHKDNASQSGIQILADNPNDDFTFGGPTFLLKFRFT